MVRLPRQLRAQPTKTRLCPQVALLPATARTHLRGEGVNRQALTDGGDSG
jgi:hypothetical protein